MTLYGACLRRFTFTSTFYSAYPFNLSIVQRISICSAGIYAALADVKFSLAEKNTIILLPPIATQIIFFIKTNTTICSTAARLEYLYESLNVQIYLLSNPSVSLTGINIVPAHSIVNGAHTNAIGSSSTVSIRTYGISKDKPNTPQRSQQRLQRIQRSQIWRWRHLRIAIAKQLVNSSYHIIRV